MDKEFKEEREPCRPDDPYAVSPAQEARGGAGDGDRADADAEAHPDFYSV